MKKQRFLPFFVFHLHLFLKYIVLISIKYCSIFVIATKKQNQFHDLTHSYLKWAPSFL